jgi:diguanylate cyclase (GGDEF)-like protein
VKVLLYDNHQEAINLLRENLNKYDFSLVVEQEPSNLFKLLNGEPPELIISNFDLPNGGIELVNTMLAVLNPPFPYVLFLTESYSKKYAVDCLGPVMGDFISLPVEEEEFTARIAVAERAIALQKYLRSQQDLPPDMAMYDDLTNLLNRQAVYERILAEMSRSQREKKPLCLAMFEVINADQIAKEYGEQTARHTIRFVARAIRANVRIYDVVGRWMGAKFLLVLPGVEKEDMRNVIGRVYHEIHSVQIRVEEDAVLDLVVAAGFTWYTPKFNVTLVQLIDQASQAMSEASKFEVGDKITGYMEIMV